MKDGQPGNTLAKCAEDGQRNRVVAAQADWTQALVKQFADFRLSIAGKGSWKVNFKSPVSQYVPSALKSTPVSVHEFDELELKATRMIGGAPAAPRNQEELASNGTPRMTGVPGLARAGMPLVIGIFLLSE